MLDNGNRGALNNGDMQIYLVNKTLWVIDQLLTGACAPSRYVIDWQPSRAALLLQLRAIYQSKLDTALSQPLTYATGLIPKWYHGKRQ
jgi:hypothetical protein